MAPILLFYRKAVVVGAGYIAVEMAGILNALGSDVTLVIRKDKVLRSFDDMISERVTEELIESGITVLKNTQVVEVKGSCEGGAKTVTTNAKEDNVIQDVDCLLWAIGRVPNVQGKKQLGGAVRIGKKIEFWSELNQ